MVIRHVQNYVFFIFVLLAAYFCKVCCYWHVNLLSVDVIGVRWSHFLVTSEYFALLVNVVFCKSLLLQLCIHNHKYGIKLLA